MLKKKNKGDKRPKLKKVRKPFYPNYTGEYRDNFPYMPKIRHKEVISSLPDLYKLREEMMKIPAFAFDTETNTLKVLSDNDEFKCVGISISWGEDNNYYIPVGHIRDEDLDRQLDLDDVVFELKKVFEREDVLILGWNLKFDFHVLKRVGITIKTKRVFDGMLASWLCNENTPNGLKENSAEKMGISQTHFKEATATVPNAIKKQFGYKSNSKVPFDLVLIDDGSPYAIDDAFYTWCCCIGYMKELEKEKMDKIYYNMYIPFLFVLFEMEEQGVTVDVEKLEKMGEEMQKDLDDLQYKIYELSGVEFNIKSSQQKAEILFGYKKSTPAISDKVPKYIEKAVNDCKAGLITRQEAESFLNSKGYVVENGKVFKSTSNPVILAHSFNFTPISFTNTGTPSTDSDTIWRLSQKTYKGKSAETKRKMQGVQMCQYMLEYAKLSKLKTAFVDGILEQLYSDDKAHPSFNQIGTDSGRLSCIAEDTDILTVGETKHIQDVKVGDLVYCYDDKGELQVRRVLNVLDRGVKECVSIKWRSQGTHDYGNLVCTPDHKIFTHHLEWVRADNLHKGDRLVHLRKDSRERPRLFGFNSYCEQEQVAIKKKVFGVYDKNICIHHKDENKDNNHLDNLALMSLSEHTRLHANELVKQGKIKTDQLRVPHRILRGKEHPYYMSITAEELTALIHEYKGRIRDIPMDFNTFKKKCKEVGLDYRKIAGQYQTQYREVSDDVFEKTFFECKGVPYAISRKLNIGRVKVQKTIDRLGLCYNHSVVSVTPCGERHVYDLEVEELHNFIAGEICVHNCSNPNLQQLPKAEEDDKYQIRSVFIGSDYCVALKTGNIYDSYEEMLEKEDNNLLKNYGYTTKRKKIIAIDYHNLEMVCLTHFSDDKNLSEMFANDDDAHGSTAVNMFNLDCTPVECKKKYPHLRQAAKTINFLLMYGGGASLLYENLKGDHFSPLDLGDKQYLEQYHCKNGVEVAQKFIDKYFESYYGVAKFIQNQKKFAHRNGYVYTILGRKRRLPDINSLDGKLSSYSERLSVNSAIQGTAGDITINAQLRVSKESRLKEMYCKMLIQVHDELVFECPEEYVEEAIKIIKYDMEHPFGDSPERCVKYLRADWGVDDNYQGAK